MSSWDTFGTAKWTMKTACSPVAGRRPQTLGRHRTEHFKDFELTLDFKIDEHGKYNSGVFYVAHEERHRPAYQINIGAAPGTSGIVSRPMATKGDKKTPSANHANGTSSIAQSARTFRSGSTKIHH